MRAIDDPYIPEAMGLLLVPTRSSTRGSVLFIGWRLMIVKRPGNVRLLGCAFPRGLKNVRSPVHVLMHMCVVNIINLARKYITFLQNK